MITPVDLKTIDAKKILCVYQPLRIHPHWENLIAGAPIHALTFHALPTWKKILLWKSNVIYARTFPRGLDYMLQALRVQMDSIPEMDLLLVDPPVSENAQMFFQKKWRLQELPQIKQAHYDAVILLYSDPVGLGWNQTERAVARLGVDCYVLNGRRRFFKFDGAARGELNWRRFLELSWIVEIFFAVAATLVSIPLMIYDLAKGSK
jgi:hypothetical protein